MPVICAPPNSNWGRSPPHWPRRPLLWRNTTRFGRQFAHAVDIWRPWRRPLASKQQPTVLLSPGMPVHNSTEGEKPMPVARIITGTPQRTTAVSEYLRSQGYTVETISPGELCVDPAELELNLEGCKPEEAVAHVQALIQQQRDDPLAQKTSSATENAQPQAARIPVAYDITGRPVEFSAEQETERRGHPNTMGRGVVFLLRPGRGGGGGGVGRAWESA